MSVRQFANSLNIIRHADHLDRRAAFRRHLMWQVRKLMPRRLIELPLSRSVITDDEQGGTMSMVNMLGLYDFNNMHLVQRVLSAFSGQATVFFDVGANIGSYTLIAAEVDGCQVVSLEPVPATFAKLERNIRLNNRGNVTALNVGASSTPGALLMTSNGSSSMNQVVEQPGDGPVITVPVDMLDAISDRLGLWPTMVKIDVEGHEPAVLAGARSTLAGCVACLIEGGDRSEIVTVMEGHGFLGPFYYDHRAAALRRTAQPVAEDQVFISTAFATTISGITIEGGRATGNRP